MADVTLTTVQELFTEAGEIFGYLAVAYPVLAPQVAAVNAAVTSVSALTDLVNPTPDQVAAVKAIRQIINQNS